MLRVLRMFCACFAHVLRMFCACFAHVVCTFQRPIFWLFFDLFCIFSKYLAASAAKYREKGGFVAKTGEGGSTDPFWNFWLLDQTRILMDFGGFGGFWWFGRVLRMFCVLLRMF